ncbi:hypothetical protein JCM10450v2_007753 [Rhodotorula kratochvilovae]
MPALTTPLQAAITFGVPKSELSEEDQARYLARFDINDPVPTRAATVPIWDVREEFDAGMGGRTAVQQLEEKGFAYVKHHSAYAHDGGLETELETEAYKAECIALYKEILGADEVIAWNVVIRDSGAGRPDVEGKMQLKTEAGSVPTSTLKAVAGSAHVDQDEDYARTIIRRAAGDDAFERYSRAEIINLWRPIRGPVTNNPLAVSDFSTMDPERDTMRMAGSYGSAYSVAYHERQRWHYLSHQTPDEAVLLLCYDSNMGKNGEALYTGHVACKVLNEERLPELVGKPEIPRRSVEVRLFALYK